MLVILLKYINTYINVGYIIPIHVCRTIKRYCVGNIPRYLNFVRKFPTQCRKNSYKFGKYSNTFYFCKKFSCTCNVGKFLQIQKQIKTHINFLHSAGKIPTNSEIK